MWKKTRTLFLSVGVVFTLLLGLIHYFVATSMNEQKARKSFLKSGLTPPAFRQASGTSESLLFVDTETEGATVIFIHGSPGSWDAYFNYLTDPSLRSKARMISVDRPGFGHNRTAVEPSLKKQAELIYSAINTVDITRPAIVVGHSLGGPVATQLCVDYPELVDALVLLAPSLDPDLEVLRWYNYLLDTRLFEILFPIDLVNSNKEILPHKRELIQLQPRLSEIQVDVRIIQGMKDVLVHPYNADYVEKYFKNVKSLKVVRLEGVNHFIPWTHESLVKETLLELIDR